MISTQVFCCNNVYMYIYNKEQQSTNYKSSIIIIANFNIKTRYYISILVIVLSISRIFINKIEL